MIRITYTLPTQRADGSALPANEIATIRAERMPADGSGVWGQAGDVAPGDPVVANLSPTSAPFKYRLTAIDTAGRLSAPSSEITVVYQAPPATVANPNPPSNLAVVVS